MEDEVVVVKIGIRGCEEAPRPWDDGAHSTIRQIVITHDKCIHSVNIEYDNNGESIWKPKHGGNRGSTSEVTTQQPLNYSLSSTSKYLFTLLESSDKLQVVLDYPNEYLISIYGYYSDLAHIMEKRVPTPTTVIRSLTLESNRKTYGPFGMEEGTKYSFPIVEAKIVGFHGSSGWFLDAIGIYVQPISSSQLVQPAQHKFEITEVEINEHFSLGEYGGKDGEPWSETFQAIKQLLIHNDEHRIVSIQMEYVDENGHFVWSNKHGGDEGSPSQVVFEFPNEYLVSIHGYYKSELGTIVIRSLTFETSKTSYGPFGNEDGTNFSFPTAGLKIVGIHGRSNTSHLNAIGLLVTLIQRY
ncbi:jacalin-related lectin 3-like isoform X1 [Cucumis melo]|uniref:Jacalin-related lectin 3-like isoform X1 n=1 Tax=Cucumis melo TaxID=3656 RepID=A0ABM3KMY3_CUCME|nr:jacalin-related lectin 3-like isoform X1 [Cucumis melo]